MGFRVRKSFGGRRGPRITVGKRSASVSLGVPGLRVTAGTRGTRVTAGIPGTGVYYTQKVSRHAAPPSPRRPSPAHPTQTPASVWSSAAVVLWLILFFPVGLWAVWQRSSWSQDRRWAVTGAFLWPLWWRFLFRAHCAQRLKVIVGLVLLTGYAAVFTPASGAAIVCVGLPGLIWALRASRPDPVEDPAALTAARQEAEHALQLCDDLVSEIEQTVTLDLLAPLSDINREYRHALDLRGQGSQALQAAATVSAAVAADRILSQAAIELQGIHHSLNPEVLEAPRSTAATGARSITTDLEKLAYLKVAGALRDTEFQQAKCMILKEER